jgi:hypothetical protein
MIIYNTITGKIPPMIFGKHIETIVFQMQIGQSIDLTNYANIENIFVKINGADDKDTIINDIKSRYNKKAKIGPFEIITSVTIQKQDNMAKLIYTCNSSHYNVCEDPKNNTRSFSPKIQEIYLESIIKTHGKTININLINSDDFDDIIRKC